MNEILIDFVPGAHGHFLEILLNKFFHTAPVDFNPFTELGTSHRVTKEYNKNKMFHAKHWTQRNPEKLAKAQKIISIRFCQDELLLFSSLSLLRAGDANIANEHLEHNTYNKLNNVFYRPILDQILSAYQLTTINEHNSDIPRHILREFYKFAFKNPDTNGYWLKQQAMTYPESCDVFYFDLECFYDQNKLVKILKQLEFFVGKPFNFSEDFFQLHNQFLEGIKYLDCKAQCDCLVQAVINEQALEIPTLTLFQESYINAKLELHYSKEMPFHQTNYFTNTKDVLQYIKTQAPNL